MQAASLEPMRFEEMRKQLNSFAISLALVMSTPSAFPFSSFQAGGGNVHEQITRDALTGTLSDTNIAYIVNAGNTQDAPDGQGVREPRRHFDDGTFASALGYIDREKKKALNFAASADTDAESRAHCLRHFGLMLHTVQDFYSRSNYVELELEDPANRASPYNLDIVNWEKVPDGYAGKKSGSALASGWHGTTTSKGQDPPGGPTYEDLNKDNAQSDEGKKTVSGTTYFKIARDLAVRETQRQWNLFETLVRGRYQQNADAIMAALKQASPAADADQD